MVESQPSKLLVAGSIPVSRSSYFRGASPLELPYAVARAARRPRSAPAGAPGGALIAGEQERAKRLGGAEWDWGPVSDRVGIWGAAPAEKAADVAQLAERVLGKDEVTSSILVIGSNRRSSSFGWQTGASSFRRQASQG